MQEDSSATVDSSSIAVVQYTYNAWSLVLSIEDAANDNLAETTICATAAMSTITRPTSTTSSHVITIPIWADSLTPTL